MNEDFDSICGAGDTAEDSERQRGRMMDYPARKIRAVQTVQVLLTQKQYHALANLTAPGPEHLQAEDPWDTAPRYLLRDRDRIFGKNVVDQIKAMGINQVLSAPRCPR
ncbi:MAG: hypothetical protein INH43_21815 [Acidobacteriaceae bacterium]|nr:hypothetical protein [Acidobacteriaceae bacterium]